MEVSESRVDVDVDVDGDGDGASSIVFQGICMIGSLASRHGVGVRLGEGVRIRILLQPGMHCAYLQNVTQVKEEHEILLPRGVKLKVIRHGIDKDYERYGQVHHCDEDQ